MAVGLPDAYYQAMANYLLKLFGPKRDKTERPGLGELDIDAHDDLSAIRRLKDTYPARLEECDCAELYGPDGKLVWEKHDEP
jgi:hypothetical protein